MLENGLRNIPGIKCSIKFTGYDLHVGFWVLANCTSELRRTMLTMVMLKKKYEKGQSTTFQN